MPLRRSFSTFMDFLLTFASHKVRPLKWQTVYVSTNKLSRFFAENAGTPGTKLTSLALLHTVVVDYSTSNFIMRKILSNKFNLDILKDKYFLETVPIIALENINDSDNIENAIKIV